jgi:hypothetical protein
MYFDGRIGKSGTDTFFRDTDNTPFANTSESEERVMILPYNSAYSKDYLGGWTIDEVLNNQRLNLSEEYYGSTATNLRYIVGDQGRLLNGNEATAHVIADVGYDHTYQIDENGIVKVVVVYDPVLVGHTLSLSAVSYNGSSRSGTSSRESFRGNGYIHSFAPSNTIDIDDQSHNIDLSIAISPTGEWLDNVTISPSSISLTSSQCTLNVANSNLNVISGHVSLVIDTHVVAGGDDTCEIDWAATNGSIYYEY